MRVATVADMVRVLSNLDQAKPLKVSGPDSGGYDVVYCPEAEVTEEKGCVIITGVGEMEDGE